VQTAEPAVDETGMRLTEDERIATPAFVYDEQQLVDDVQAVRTAVGPDVQLLLAMKAFCLDAGLRTIAPLLDGLHASSLFETRLGRSILGDEGLIHVTTPGLRDDEIAEIAALADLVSFNSLSQWHRLRRAGEPREGWGLRVNPALSVAKDPRYDPCGRFPRLGVPVDVLAELAGRAPAELAGLSGLLVHSNCEGTDVTPLLRTVEILEGRLGPLLDRLRWIDLGGGYLLQDVEDMGPLHEAVQRMRARGLVVVMEPGSAIVASAGYLVGSVVDVFDAQGQRIAVLDTSINHAPEVFEYSWSPDVVGAEHAAEDEVDEGVHLVTGSTCLAGDVFGRYRFPAPLEIGARVVFTDLGAYSLVKAHRFNGVNLPTVYALRHGEPIMIREFTFPEFVSHYGGTDASVRGQLRDGGRPEAALAQPTAAGGAAAIR
jgi:carboxynorspermidine decarboxylase